MKQTVLVWMIGVAVGLASCASAHDVGWPAKKLDALIPGAKFTPRKYKLTPEQVKTIEAKFSEENANGKLHKEDIEGTAYVGVGKDPKTGKTTTLGVVLFVDPKGPRGWMEAGIAVDPKGKLLSVRVFEHKEGKTLNDATFLKQFVGKTTKDMLHVGHDLKASGADGPAVQALASGVKRMLFVLEAAFGKPTTDGEKPTSESGSKKTS